MNLKPFDAFKGKTFDKVADAIALAAHAQHYTVSELDPANGISSNIDVEPNRLNVHLDAEGRVVKFSIG